MKTTKPDSLQAALEEMFEANTGRSLLDSGSAYGRHWERNQDGAYKRRQPICLQASSGRAGDGEVWGTMSTYHFLRENLQLAPTVKSRIEEFCNLVPEGNFYENFGDFMWDYHDARIADPFGGRKGGMIEVNTYNSQYTYLSQVLQFKIFAVDGDAHINPSDTFVYLQLHNGCDVRGGYTRPRAFKVNGTIHDFQAGMEGFTLKDDSNSRWDFEAGRLRSWDEDVKELQEYPVVSSKILTGRAIDNHDLEPDPEAKELQETIDTWTRKVDRHGDRLTDEQIIKHEETVGYMKARIHNRLQEIAAEGNVVFVPSGETPDGHGATLFSPVDGSKLSAFI